jgi:hypothetical protein
MMHFLIFYIFDNPINMRMRIGKSTIPLLSLRSLRGKNPVLRTVSIYEPFAIEIGRKPIVYHLSISKNHP